MNYQEYPIERPDWPVTIYFLGFVIVIGLLALGIAAFTAFSNVAGFWQALFASLLVEVGAIVEAITLVRGKNGLGFAGLVVSLLVSGTYNYVQAEQAGKLNGITGWWQLGTLALGPLFALAFLSLTLGKEIRKYEESDMTWQQDKMKWDIDAVNKKREKEEQDTQKQLEKERQETERQQKELELKIKMEEEERLQRLKIEQEERMRRIELEEKERQARLELELEKEKLRLRNEVKLEKIRLKNESKKEGKTIEIDGIIANIPNFSRGYQGFVEYLSWLDQMGLIFDKKNAAQHMGRTVRSIENYMQEGFSNGSAELLNRLSQKN